MPGQRSVVVFDLGGVVVDWNPRYLYRKLFRGDDQAMEHFLATVCTQSWNEQQDAGRTFADACASPDKTEIRDLTVVTNGRDKFPLRAVGNYPLALCFASTASSTRVE